MKYFHFGTENHPAFACFISMTMSVQVNTAGGISVLVITERFVVFCGVLLRNFLFSFVLYCFTTYTPLSILQKKVIGKPDNLFLKNKILVTF